MRRLQCIVFNKVSSKFGEYVTDIVESCDYISATDTATAVLFYLDVCNSLEAIVREPKYK